MCTDVDFWEHDFECCSCTVLYIFYTIKDKSLLDFYMILQSFSSVLWVFYSSCTCLFIYSFFFFFRRRDAEMSKNKPNMESN